MLQYRVRERSMHITPDGRLSRPHAATYLGVAVQTLANWGSLGRGPKWMKLGGKVFYRLADLEAFVAATAQGK